MTHRILVVDDEPMVTDWLKMVIEQAPAQPGYEVRVASHGDRGADHAVSHYALADQADEVVDILVGGGEFVTAGLAKENPALDFGRRIRRHGVLEPIPGSAPLSPEAVAADMARLVEGG